MDSRVHAGIEFDGTVLRYAEIERVGDGLRLLRLGECDFPFEPFGVLRDGDEEGLDILQEALGDVYHGSQADSLRVAFHPHDVLTWTAPFPQGLSQTARNERLRKEVGLMAGADAPNMQLTMHPLRQSTAADGALIDWVQVVALDDGMHARVESLGDIFSSPTVRMGLSTQGAAVAIERLHRDAMRRNSGPVLLCGIGQYERHTEYVVVQDGVLLLSSAGDRMPGSNAVFTLLQLLQQAGHYAQQVSALYVYGTTVRQPTLNALPDVFGGPARVGNPLTALMIDEPGGADPFEASAYAPSVGIAL